MVNRDTLSVIVRKKAMTDKTAWERSAGIDIAGLVSSRQSINRQVNQLVNGLYEKGKTLAVWGASHQGFTLAATTGLGKGARYIMDSAPFKQGRFAPASHILIVAPDHFLEEPVDAILIVAPGYTDEIAGIIREKYEKGPGGEKTRIFTLRSSDIEEIT